jgi:hypothetical protein
MTRRDNGLHAPAYVRVIDVETHLVDGLLERLRDEQVAAYVAPAAGHRGPYGETVLPRTPSDSVYVDSGLVERARSVIERYLSDVQEELAWASIIAGYDEPSADQVPRWPVSEDLPAAPEDDLGAGPGRVVRPAAPTIGFEELRDVANSPTGPVPPPPAEDPEEHFEPPTPPPVPVPDTVGRFAWAAAVGGPLFLLLGTLLGVDISGWPGFLAFGAFVGGFLTLVARMKDRPGSGGDDDGAVV